MTDRPIKRVFTTKYALTQGIQELEVRPSRDGDERYVYTTDNRCFQQFRMDRDAFDTRELAIIAAMEMRTKKIRSLKGQITRLRALKFS